MQPRLRAQICSPYMTVLLTPGPAPSDFDRIDRIDGLDGIEFDSNGAPDLDPIESIEVRWRWSGCEEHCDVWQTDQLRSSCRTRARANAAALPFAFPAHAL